MKLIDADKLLRWLGTTEPADLFIDGTLGEWIGAAIESGTFDPTPVQPDTPKPEDKVRHKDKRMKYLGIGNVLEVAASGKTVRVDWPNYDKTKCNWAPYPAYYRLDKLEVIKDE